MLKKFKEKKAASLMMILWYSVILFWLSWLLIWMLVSSQRFVWISEKYNMAIYWAESWIEQALYEINIHDVWFNDSTNFKTQADSDWFLNLFWERLKYKWSVEWLNELNTEEWYLLWKWNIDKISENDENKRYYKDFRNFFLYKDIWLIWESKNIQNICENDSSIINFSVNWTNIYVDLESNKTNIVQWRVNTKEINESWTWYYLESMSECSEDWNSKDPFCFKSTKNFTNSWNLEFNSTHTTWECFSDIWEECTEQNIVDFLNQDDDPISSWNQNWKPELIISYQNKLYEVWNETEWVPIKYKFSWCLDKIPSLSYDIESIAQTYWSVQKISTRIYQWDQWINLNYTIIQ